MSSFRSVRILDNFYQTSAFFPMPTVLVSTLAEDGSTSLGAYSLLQPYYVAGRDYYAMLLCARNSSNTAQHLLRYGKCALNFITDEKKYFKEAVRLGFPGDMPQEKMQNCIFTLEKGQMAAEHPDQPFPMVVHESFQVMECTWMRELDNAQEDKPGLFEGYPGPYHDFNGITSPMGAHFILRVDKILLKDKYYRSIINGTKASVFPRIPVDYGFRDSQKFWYSRFRRPHTQPLPDRKASLDAVRDAAGRVDEVVKFTDEACLKLVRVPRIFLMIVLRGCVKWAKENNVTLITGEHIDIINDKRSQEKGKK
jgi:flavin reductase (DIM6/NTAB) family NADH-FMN oxidoreductase RutF